MLPAATRCRFISSRFGANGTKIEPKRVAFPNKLSFVTRSSDNCCMEVRVTKREKMAAVKGLLKEIEELIAEDLDAKDEHEAKVPALDLVKSALEMIEVYADDMPIKKNWQIS